MTPETEAAEFAKRDEFLDIRVALVLYGGVSLAVYENGVTRSFYDLVKRRGIFPILLDLLGAKAQVDVIAGTSAGGINGLLLAATLESGADFTDSANLWRRLGDLGALLRDPADANTAQSLLKGETYYQDSLIDAFRKYCTPSEGTRRQEYPDEIDVFITGTDLDGAERTNWDTLGNLISDKEHRVVFRLEHRPRRKALGYVRQKKAEVDPYEQGTILGTVARITSSFPAAFPPFRIEHLAAKHGRYQKAVQEALERTAQTEIVQTPERSFADGGLLDNKPFGLVLDAVFHRMPTTVVDRRLFYVEPDPEPRPGPPNPKGHTPLGVATASLLTIPAHESIWEDLQQLERHNAQVRWLKQLKKSAAKGVRDGAHAAANDPGWSPYWETRVESLARSLFLASEVTSPSAQDEIANPAHRKLMNLVRDGLRVWTKPESDDSAADSPAVAPMLNSFDIDFHLRRSFHLLYDLFGALEAPAVETAAQNPVDRDACRDAMRLVGRVIKAQKMIRDLMLALRTRVLEKAAELEGRSGLPEDRAGAASALLIVNFYRLFLRNNAPHWQSLLPHCNRRRDEIPKLTTDWTEFFASLDLTAAADAAWVVAREPLTLAAHLQPSGGEGDLLEAVADEDVSVRTTILNEIEKATRAVVDGLCRGRGMDGFARAFDGFLDIDRVTYPLEFAGASYELDEIECVRISPQDAQTALSRGEARDKVAGDELFHFAAFLRQDWRSNDILRGRFDGICQIVSALLAPSTETVRRLAAGLSDLGDRDLIDPSGPANDLRCFDESWPALHAAWGGLAAALKREGIGCDDYKPSQAVADALAEFARCLVRVGQEDAFAADFPLVYEDHLYQDMAFGSPPPEKDGVADAQAAAGAADAAKKTAAEASSPAALEALAKEMSKKVLDGETQPEQLDRFQRMNLGGQPVKGRNVIPPHIVGEYATQAYLLLFGMIRSSLGEKGRAVLDRTTVRAVLRQPLAFMNVIFFLMRSAYVAALGSIATTAGLLIGTAAAAYLLDGSWLVLAAVAALLLFVAVVSWAAPRMKRRPMAIALLPAVVLGALALAAAIARRLPDWSTQIAEFLGHPQLPAAFGVGVLVGVLGAAVAWIGMRRRK